MTIEIRQLVIRVVAQSGQAPSGERSAGQKLPAFEVAHSVAERKQEENRVVARCVREVLRTLRRRQER